MSKYIMGALALVAILATMIYLFRSEGERSRQTMRDLKDEIREEMAREVHENIAAMPMKAIESISETVHSGEMVSTLAGIFTGMIREADKIFTEAVALTDEEIEVYGNQFKEDILDDKALVNNRLEMRKIERLTAKLLPYQEYTAGFFRHYIYRDEAINAFTHLGGHIYYADTLLEVFADSESALMFVIAHEIAHNILGHVHVSATRLVRAGQLGEDLGLIAASVYSQVIAVGYSNEQEYEADEWAFRMMVEELGYTREDALMGLKLLDQSSRDPTTNGKRVDAVVRNENAVGRAIAKSIGDHFATHPDLHDRIRRLEGLSVNIKSR